MFLKESKTDFIKKVIDYGVGVNLSGYSIGEFSLELSEHFNKFTYYNSNLVSSNKIKIVDDLDKICELEVTNLGILFNNYDKHMAVKLVPTLVKFVTKKTFN